MILNQVSGYLFGFDIADPLHFLRHEFALNEYWEVFATTSLALGYVISCLLAGSFSNKYGRKTGLMIAAFRLFISSFSMAFSYAKSLFITSSFVAGFKVGMGSILSSIYIAEIPPARTRRRMAAISQMYAMNLGTKTLGLHSEIFPTHIRGAVSSVTKISLWVSSALLVFIFPILASKLGAYTPFYICAVICFVGFVFTKLKLKEIKGNTLEDLASVFAVH